MSPCRSTFERIQRKSISYVSETQQSTAIAAVKIGGLAPVAVAGLVGGTSRMTAGQTEYFAVNPCDAVAVIATT
jgi:hypothetical protein